MDVRDLPLEEALDLYFELIHALEADDHATLDELDAHYPGLFEEETLMSLADLAERVQIIGEKQSLPPLPNTEARKARIELQLDRINKLVRENPQFFDDHPNNDLLYIELAVEKLASLIVRDATYKQALADKSGKIAIFKSKRKRSKIKKSPSKE